TSAALASPGIAASSSAGSSYTVQPGDTLGAIANRFGTSVTALSAANGITNPNRIFVGQVLTVAGPSSPAAAPTTSYTVQLGDTLGAIANRFGTSVAALSAANGITNPNRIFVGQVLQVSGAGPAAAPVATGTS